MSHCKHPFAAQVCPGNRFTLTTCGETRCRRSQNGHISARNWAQLCTTKSLLPSFFPSNLSNIHPIVECVSTCLASTRNIVCIIAGTSFGHMLYLNHGTMAPFNRTPEIRSMGSIASFLRKITRPWYAISLNEGGQGGRSL